VRVGLGEAGAHVLLAEVGDFHSGTDSTVRGIIAAHPEIPMEGLYDYDDGISAVDSLLVRPGQTAVHIVVERGRAAPRRARASA